MRERICSLARDDCGQSIVLVSLFLVVLLGFVGLVVDAGFAFTQRRQMQNAADAAALAGARELALGGDRSAVWNTIYEYGVQRNLADTISGTFYPQGQPIKPNPGTPPTPATGVCVTTIKDLPTTFLAMFGIPSIHISAEACADEPPIQCGGGYALWAHSTSCSKTIDWTGGQWRVTGDVHSNNDLSASGNGNHANGTCEYVSDLDKQLHCTASVQGAVNMDYPVDFTIADYMPGGRAAGAAGPDYYYFASAAGFSTAASLPDGLYFFDGGGTTNVSAPGLAGRHLTLVTTGRINWSAGSADVSPYVDNLFLFSTASQNCNSGNFAINYSGSNSVVLGIMYAPNGGIQVSGSNDSTLAASLIANTIKLTGSHGELDQSALSCSGGPRTIKLISP